MSLWSRLRNTFRGGRMSREIQDELELHIADAIEEGRDPEEARRALGPALLHRERSRDIRLLPWLDSLRADAAFGWRQLLRRKGASAAAVLSLALGIGACTAAFRLVDALLWRPLPIAHPDRLHAIFYTFPDGKGDGGWDTCSYPAFRVMRAQVKDEAELVASAHADLADVTYASDHEMEKARPEYVSGWFFDALAIRPALGRLLTANDDVRPGGHPYAVLSYDYWTRRFGRDPKAIGRKVRIGDTAFEIVGVAAKGFTGIEPGVVTDFWIPTMMKHPQMLASGSAFWFRTLVLPRPGVSVEALREKLSALHHAIERERLAGVKDIPREVLERNARIILKVNPAPAGVSRMQRDYRRPLLILGALAVLVLLIACANVANLLTAQAAARAREMALRVSIGAGRARLVQLVLVEGALIAGLAAACGALLAWWAAPVVVSMLNSPHEPARLILPADWRVLGFGAALAFGVAVLFGLPAALRASSVKPALALKGGEPTRSRRRLMRLLVAAQASFCFPVLFVAGLFVATMEHLDRQPIGFSPDRVIALETVASHPQPRAHWESVVGRLRSVPGVEHAALSGWALLSGSMTNNYIFINGVRAGTDLTFFNFVTPGWLDTMRVPLLEGADFRPDDVAPGPAIVNQAFLRRYFPEGGALGRWFEQAQPDGARTRFYIAGVVPDVRDLTLRNPIPPTVFIPFSSNLTRMATIVVRANDDNLTALAPILRQEVAKARPEFRVSNIRMQSEIVRAHTLRERLLAALAVFFGAVALLLAAIGLYGVLDYSVLQRRREIGIRIALGAQAGEIARRVTVEGLATALAGGAVGVAIGMAAARYVETLLFDVRPSAWPMLAGPAAALAIAALLAAIPPALRAVRTDPSRMLRSE